MAALDASVPDLNIENSLRFTERSNANLFVFVGTDQAVSLSRMKMNISDKAFEHNEKMVLEGRIGTCFCFCLEGMCVGHILSGIAQRSFNASRLIPKAYALEWVCGQAPLLNKLIRSLVMIITREFHYQRVESKPVCPDHNKALLELTFLRERRTRGRNDITSMSMHEDTLQAIEAASEDMANVDFRRPACGHRCWIVLETQKRHCAGAVPWRNLRIGRFAS